MEEDYYSIGSILADSQKLTCQFTLDVNGLGALEGGSEPDLKQETKAELPYWLANTLSLNGFTRFFIPPPYSHRVKSALNASSSNVRLSSLVGTNGWWYAWGRRITSIMDDKARKDILGMMLKAFIQRLPLIQDLSAHYGSASTSSSLASISSESRGGGLNTIGEDFKEGMDAEERELFVMGQEGSRRVKVWYDTSIEKSRRL